MNSLYLSPKNLCNLELTWTNYYKAWRFLGTKSFSLSLCCFVLGQIHYLSFQIWTLLALFSFWSKSRPVPSQDRTGKAVKIPLRPILCQNPIPAHPMARFRACPFVLGQWRDFCPVVPLLRDNDRTSVPLSQETRKSCPVGISNRY